MARRILLTAIAAVAILAALSATLAPYLYAELWPWRYSFSVIKDGPVTIAKGRMFDDYFVVQELGDGTFAIGEPRYYQANYSYLIIGNTRAVLFDAGSGYRSMRPVISSLTLLPVTVIPSHLHFDHLAGLADFDHVALIDLASTRARTVNGRFTPGRYDFLGMFDGQEAPAVQVSEWIKPGTSIDLGGRSLTILSTPGHTPQSVALLDRRARRLFTGDFIYPTMLYAFLPGASLSDYQNTADGLLTTLPADTILWGAHCCRRDEDFSAPWLSMDDLKDLDRTLKHMETGELESEGFFPHRYVVNHQITLATGFSWNNR